MTAENPMFHLLMIAAGTYVSNMWWSDLRNHRAGATDTGGALPGARPASRRAITVAVAGALAILAGETMGEIALDLSAEQSEITVLFGLYTLVAAVIEEIIFRGYVVVLKRSRAAMIGSVLAASFLFAAIHPFLWTWDMGNASGMDFFQIWRWSEWFNLTLTLKGWFSFGAVWLASIWFYTCRLASWNPERSLLPCFAAHAAKNAGVFAIKAAQGFVIGLW